MSVRTGKSVFLAVVTCVLGPYETPDFLPGAVWGDQKAFGAVHLSSTFPVSLSAFHSSRL